MSQTATIAANEQLQPTKISTLNVSHTETPIQPTQPTPNPSQNKSTQPSQPSQGLQTSQRPIRTRHASQKAAYSLASAWQPLSALLDEDISGTDSGEATITESSGSEADATNGFGVTRPGGRKRRFGRVGRHKGPTAGEEEDEDESDSEEYGAVRSAKRRGNGGASKRVKSGGGGGYGAKKLDLGDYEVIGEIHPKWRNRARPERKNVGANRRGGLKEKKVVVGLKKGQVERLMEFVGRVVDWGNAARTIGVGVAGDSRDVISVASALNGVGSGSAVSVSVRTAVELERHWREVLSKAIVEMYVD